MVYLLFGRLARESSHFPVGTCQPCSWQKLEGSIDFAVMLQPVLPWGVGEGAWASSCVLQHQDMSQSSCGCLGGISS